MISYPFSILYKVSTSKGVPEEVRCHEIVFQAASQRDISLMYFPQSRIWSMALHTRKLDLSTKLEQIHILKVDLQLEEHKIPKIDISRCKYINLQR